MQVNNFMLYREAKMYTDYKLKATKWIIEVVLQVHVTGARKGREEWQYNSSSQPFDQRTPSWEVTYMLLSFEALTAVFTYAPSQCQYRMLIVTWFWLICKHSGRFSKQAQIQFEFDIANSLLTTTFNKYQKGSYELINIVVWKTMC